MNDQDNHDRDNHDRDNHDRGSIHTLTGAYALDALDDVERRRFEQHLTECPDCRAEVQGFLETVVRLAEVSREAPPPALRDRVLADIKQIRPLPPEPVEQPAESGHGPTRRPDGRHASRLSTRMRLLGAAAAILAVVGIGTAVVQPWHSGPTHSQLSVADRVLRATDAQRVSASLPGGAHATVVRSQRLGRAVLLTHSMPPAPDGKVYELWLQAPSGKMRPAGLMSRAGDRTVLLQGDAADARAAGITVEPAGGSEQPTSAPIALFDFHTRKAT